MIEPESPIYHLLPEADWGQAQRAGSLRPSSLETEGFVHCAEAASVLPVADDYFAGLEGALLLLEIDPARLEAPLRYEAPAPGPGAGRAHLEGVDHFPHVYGPISLEAIARAGVLRPSEDGYRWPERMEPLAPAPGEGAK